MSRAMTVGDVLNRLSERGCRPKRSGNGQWNARCPAHDDRNPSLSIGEGDEGRILLECHAGCETAAVCAALDLTMADLSGPSSGDDWTPYGPAVATYRYDDEHGRELFTVHRTSDKQFPCSRPDATAKSGRRWKLGDTRRALYRLQRVLDAVKAGDTIYVVEGEKDVHAIERAGAVATCLERCGVGQQLRDHRR